MLPAAVTSTPGCGRLPICARDRDHTAAEIPPCELHLADGPDAGLDDATSDLRRRTDPGTDHDEVSSQDSLHVVLTGLGGDSFGLQPRCRLDRPALGRYIARVHAPAARGGQAGGSLTRHAKPQHSHLRPRLERRGTPRLHLPDHRTFMVARPVNAKMIATM